MAFAGRHRRPGSIVYVDVNDLKRINDTFGHAAGDAVLTRVAQVLNANVRKSDAVGRLGGDEFGVILSHADSAIARTKTEALIAAIRRGCVDWNGVGIPLSVSAGCYTFHGAEHRQSCVEGTGVAVRVGLGGGPNVK